MTGSRTIRTLTALFAAMTIGAIALMMMETDPVRPPLAPVAAMSAPSDTPDKAVYDKYVSFQPLKWRNIVIHSTSGEPGNIAARCHFVVDQPDDSGNVTVAATDLWKRQTEGNHVNIPGHDFNAISVGICLVGDYSTTPPSHPQVNALVQLVRTLQSEFAVSADHVYLHSDLVRGSRSPGPAFPDISSQLLKPER